jgi:ribosomal protein S8E
MDGVTVIGKSLAVDNWSFPVETVNLTASKDNDCNLYDVPQSMARAIMRTDTNEVLGVHGSKYKAIMHDDVVNSIMDAVQDSGISKDYDTNIELFDNGAKLRGTINFNDLVIEPSINDYVRFQVKFYNSYDGSWAFQQQAQGLRLWCLNGCTHADTVANTWAKHTTNVNVKGSASKIQLGLSSFFNTKDKYLEWKAQPVSHETAENFFKFHICKVKSNTTENKFNNRALDTLMSCWRTDASNLGENKWALYNACTYWASHTSESRSPANTQRLRENQLSKAFKSDYWLA